MNSSAEVVLAVFEAVESRDREKLFELYHEDVEFHEARSLPYGGSKRGKEVLRRQLETAPGETWLGTWGPLQPTDEERRMDPRVVASNGEEVVVSYRQRAVGPDGERFDKPVLGIYEVRDGKFARAQMFHFDTAAIVDFLGRVASRTPGMATSV
jgi:ketosteroid isomerase-like protein